MRYPLLAFAAIATLPLLAGCAPLDAVEGKSPGQEYVLRLTAMEAEMASLRAGVADGIVEVVPGAEVVVPVAAQPAPECYGDVFRVSRCVGGKMEAW